MTEQELADVIAFYKSPTGQKVVTVLPAIERRSKSFFCSSELFSFNVVPIRSSITSIRKRTFSSRCVSVMIWSISSCCFAEGADCAAKAGTAAARRSTAARRRIRAL
ncbi:MAG TPA: DUF2059 domain-containing protein [Thermoanaerobaculia bacterium]|nr:DUF2059 domain-containing protein [Thermoanaerobaculia bacterium]